MRTNIKNIVNEVINDSLGKTDRSYDEFSDKFLKYANELKDELEREFLSNIGISVRINMQYVFTHNDWVAAYERSSGEISKGILSIAVNIPLLYRIMRKNKTEKDEFNIKAQARISVGHEIGHGIIDYLIDYYDGDNPLIEKFCSDYWNGEIDEEEIVEEFGEWTFPEATGTYTCTLASLLGQIA